MDQKIRKRTTIGWCLYDWANSAFPTIIMTFIFATYFTKGIAPTPEEGTIIWGQAMAVAGFVLALLAPICGAIADHAGNRGRWLFLCTLVCILASAALWFAYPNPDSMLYAAVFAVIGIIGFEFSMVFYNAYLPEVAPKSHWGRVSGWGWGLGYFGGLIALAISLFGFVQTDNPLFGLGKDNAENIRATFLLVAVWFGVFCIPTFLTLPKSQQAAMPLRQAIPLGLVELARNLRELYKEKTVMQYLLARMIYADGLNTLFVFGGIFAAGTFGMPLEDVILFGIALNVTAGLGAVGFAWLDDLVGSKAVLLFSLASMSVLGSIGAATEHVETFWIVGLSIGVFLGPVQSASRSLLARMTPESRHTEYFGLYALSGKATSFLGPWLLSIFTAVFQSQRAGMGVIVIFLVVGGLWLWRLDLKKYQ